MMKLLLVLGATCAQMVGAGLSGAWSGTLETPAGRVSVLLTLTEVRPNVWGTFRFREDGITEIENASLHGDRFSFEVHDTAQHLAFFRVVVNGDVLSGEAMVDKLQSRITFHRVTGNPHSTDERLTAPAIVSQVKPEYTLEAHIAKIQGVVVVEAWIDAVGRVGTVTVEKGLGWGLDDKAIECVRKWKFRPAVSGGRPSVAAVRLLVPFRL